MEKKEKKGENHKEFVVADPGKMALPNVILLDKICRLHLIIKELAVVLI